ncbi:MAG: DUF3261 domain-containing protein [Sandaracinaceae bacterium]|nr:DUF3261 domain-containing protein [Sandaracinaceae bacterium]
MKAATSISTLLICVVVMACGGLSPRTAYPGTLRAPTTMAANFMMRQRLTVTRVGAEPVRFESVLQKSGNALVLLGLTPFGTRAFLIELTGTDVRYESYLPGELPFPPQYILFDVQRTVFPFLSDSALSDGWHEERSGEELVRERWQGGLLVERTFERTSEVPPGQIRVVYETGVLPGTMPPTTHFYNAWMGYELTIETVEQSALP